MTEKVKKELIVVAVVIAFVVFSYLPIFNGFFQQDEWLAFGYHYLWVTQGWNVFLRDIFVPSVGHYQPLNTLVIHSLFRVFGLNFAPYVVISILLHICNSVLVYLLAKKLFNSVSLSLVVMALFSIMASSFQATAWVLADLGIHFATLLAILSLLTWLTFLETRSSKYFTISLGSLLVSLLFKEIAVGFFALLPLTLWFFAPATFSKKRR